MNPAALPLTALTRVVPAGDIAGDGWTSGNHIAVDTSGWSSGPEASLPGRALDSTDLLWAMKAVMYSIDFKVSEEKVIRGDLALLS